MSKVRSHVGVQINVPNVLRKTPVYKYAGIKNYNKYYYDID